MAITLRNIPEKARHKCFRHILKPVVKMCLEGADTIRALLEILKSIFVELAIEDLQSRGETPTISRISVMTGVHRADVSRILSDGPQPSLEVGLVARIISQWEHNSKFCIRKGVPRVLSTSGENSDFYLLVRSVNKSLNPATLLFEMERQGLIERTNRGVKLRLHLHVMKDDPEKGIDLLARNMETLIAAAQENIFFPRDLRNVHIRTEFDNIFESDIPAVREWLSRESKAFHKRVRDYLAEHDQDINPSSEVESGVKVAIVSVGFTYEPRPDSNVEAKPVRSTRRSKGAANS